MKGGDVRPDMMWSQSQEADFVCATFRKGVGIKGIEIVRWRKLRYTCLLNVKAAADCSFCCDDATRHLLQPGLALGKKFAGGSTPNAIEPKAVFL